MCGPDSEVSQINPWIGHGAKRSLPRTQPIDVWYLCCPALQPFIEYLRLIVGEAFPFQLLNRERNIRFDAYGSPIHRGFGSSIVHSTFSGQPLHTSVDLAPYFSPLAYMDVVGSRDYPTRKQFVGTISPNTTTPPPTPRLSIPSSSFEALS